MSPELKTYLTDRAAESERIPEDRRNTLGELARFVATRQAAGKEALLVFICTHNSRRSHMAQAAAQAAAEYFGLKSIRCFSGGTESTAFFPGAIEAVRAAGFSVEQSGAGVSKSNPRYAVRTGPDSPPEYFFSKRFNDPENPAGDFAAIMTCGEADEACPFVPGAAVRIRLTYDDPKAFDGTTEAPLRYAERLADITRELVFAMSQVAADVPR